MGAFSCLVAVSLSVPTPDAKADAFYGYGLGHAIAPVAYHVPACTVEETTITHKVCTPKTEQKCEDIVYKTIVVKPKEVCVDLITKHCSDGTVSTAEATADAAVEAERKKREADPAYALGLGYHGLGLAHHAVVAPIVTVKHHCVETPTRLAISSQRRRLLRTPSLTASWLMPPLVKMWRPKYLTPCAIDEF